MGRLGSFFSFFSQMSLAAALSLGRGFILAALLAPSSFGIYAAVMGAGQFCSFLLGLGRIEATNKLFPRLFVDGHSEFARREADRLCLRIALNAASLAIATTSILLLIGQGEWVATALAVLGVALTTALVTVYISLNRAGGDLHSVSRANLARAVLALIFSTSGAMAGGWLLPVIGETIAALLAAFLFRRLVRVTPATSPAREKSEGGLWLLGSSFVGLAPICLDRSYVALMFGAAVAGTHGFLMLFVLGATTLIGIFVQKVGPELIHLQRKGNEAAQIPLLLRWCGVYMIAIVGGMSMFSLLLKWPFSGLAERYMVGFDLLLATTLLALAQITPLLDWLLLSRDRESRVFAASVANFVAAATLASLAVATIGTLVSVIAALAVAKLAQIFVQLLRVSGPASHPIRTKAL